MKGRRTQRGGRQDTGASQSRCETRIYPILRASAEAFECRGQTSQNPGLIFDRFAPQWEADGTIKKEALMVVRRAGAATDAELLRSWNRRWAALVRAANAAPFSLKTDWRLVAGLGRKGPLEVGFTFHRYGFPVLPGTSVKGVARAWALLQIASKCGNALSDLDDVLSADGPEGSEGRKKYEGWRIQQGADVQKLADAFRAVFGTTAVAGRAVFFDAIPAQAPALELDIINPHYPAYYGGNEPPTDGQSPVPTYFLTVAPAQEFRFAVGWRGTMGEEDTRLREQAVLCLRHGLQELGVGAKTSGGYGYFAVREAVVEQKPAQEPTETSVQPEPVKTPEPITWRRAVVREYRPDKGIGRLVDDESGEQLPFRKDAIEDKGWSPGKRAKVRYALAQREGRQVVVKVQRLS